MKAPSRAPRPVHFKDDATAFNKKKHDVIEGKGVLNNRISEYIFTHLNRIGMPTHFIKRLNMREQLMREVEIIPLEVVVRNVAAGSMAKRLGIEEGTLPRSIIEFYYKNDELDDPMVAEEHVTAFGWASPQEIDDIMAMPSASTISCPACSSASASSWSTSRSSAAGSTKAT
jgi:phosphoribosylaminoimidazole-succinocarboxamide synthase